MFDVALRLESVVIRTAACKPRLGPSWGMKATCAAKLAAFLVVGNAHTTMAALAKRLDAMASTTVGRIPTSFYGVHANVVAGMKIHRLDTAVVALDTKVLFMTRGTKAFVVLGGVFVGRAKLHRVGCAAQTAAGLQGSKTGKLTLHRTPHLGKVTGCARVGRNRAIMTPLARAHRRQLGLGGLLNLAHIAMTGCAWRLSIQVCLVAKLEVRNRHLHSSHLPAHRIKMRMAGDASRRGA